MRYGLIALALALGGCAETGGIVGQAGDQTAEAADIAYELTRRAYCDGTTMGAARRALGSNPEALEAYLADCGWKTWPNNTGDN